MGDLLPAVSVAPETEEAISEFVSNPLEFLKYYFNLELLIRVVLLFLICIVVMKVLMTALNRLLLRGKVERSLHTFIKSSTRILLWFITVILVAASLGIDVGALLGVLGIFGLAVSLAIQGTLSNLAGGIMILVSKPFVVGDYIEAGGVSGTVHDIGMVYTRIQTVDNKIIFVPNGEISGEKIVNSTAQDKRRVDLKFNTSYGDDPEVVKGCIRGIIDAHPKAMCTPEPFVRVSGYHDSSVEYTARVWCATGDYWDLYSDLLEQVKAAFDRAGVEMTYNHVNVHLVEDKTKRP